MVEVMVWLTRSLTSDLKEGFSSDTCAWILFKALTAPDPHKVLGCILGLGPANAIDEAHDPNGYTAFHYAASHAYHHSISPLLAWKPDLLAIMSCTASK